MPSSMPGDAAGSPGRGPAGTAATATDSATGEGRWQEGFE